MVKYLELKGIGINEFAEDESFGKPFDKGTLGKAAKADGAIGTYAVEKFLRRFADVSPYWLFLGEGSITRDWKLEDAYVQTLKDVIIKLEANITDLRGSVRDKDKIITFLERSGG